MNHSLNRNKTESILKMARITEAPVDVKKIAEVLGFLVVPYDFPKKQKGRIIIKEDIKAIGVNKNHPETLQRFSIAHEIGHFLSGHAFYEHVYSDDENRLYDPYFHQEREADLFASELLMPKNFLIKDLNAFGLDIKKLIEKYQVSEQAMWIRLTSLNLAEKYSPVHDKKIKEFSKF